MRISDWSSDVCSSDLPVTERLIADDPRAVIELRSADAVELLLLVRPAQFGSDVERRGDLIAERSIDRPSSRHDPPAVGRRSEERRVGKECVSPFSSRWSQYH